MPNPLKQPVLIYDGACKFCIQQLRNMQRFVGNRFQAYSFRETETMRQFPQLELEECEKSIQFIEEDGRIYDGAEAFFRLLARRNHFKPFLWVYYIPGVRALFEWLYKNISTHRHRISLWFKS